MIMRLKSDYVLRRNGNKILLLPAKVRSYETNRYVIHPVAAIVLALLNNLGDQQQTSNVVAHVFGASQERAKEITETVITSLSWAIEEADSAGKYIDPKRFVVKADEIDLDNTTYSYPASICYITTYDCPGRCVYCYAYRGACDKLLSFEKFIELIDEGASHGLDTLFLSGGEPFWHPRIFDMIKATLDRGITCFTSTKLELSDQDVAKLSQTGIEELQVSLDSHIPAVAEALTGIPGQVDMASRTIRRLRQAGLKVLSNSVVTAINVDTILDTVEYLISLGVSNVGLSAYGRSIWRHKDELFAPVMKLVALGDSLEEVRRRYPHVLISYSYKPEPNTPEAKKLEWENRVRCTAGREAITILPDGKVGWCEMMAPWGGIVGDLNSQSLLEIWNSASVKAMVTPSRERFSGTACFTCPDFIGCHLGKGRCVRNVVAAYHKTDAPDPACPLAPPAPRLR